MKYYIGLEMGKDQQIHEVLSIIDWVQMGKEQSYKIIFSIGYRSTVNG